MFKSLNSRALGLNLDADETINAAAQAGFDGADLLVRDIVDSNTDVDRLRSRMTDKGLRPGAWPLPMNWKAEQESFDCDLRRLPNYAEAAAKLGLYRTGTWVLPELPDHTDFDETAQWHFDRLGAMAKVLDRFGIRLGLEVIGVESSRPGRNAPFVHCLDDLKRVFQPLIDNTPNVGLLLDGFHLYAAGEAIEAGLSWGVSSIVWVHVADLPSENLDRSAIQDPIRGLPGETPAVGTRALLRNLAKSGYDGPVTAEPFAKCPALVGLNPIETIDRVAKALQSVWPG